MTDERWTYADGYDDGERDTLAHVHDAYWLVEKPALARGLKPALPRLSRPRWGVLSEDGTTYSVVRWKGGRRRHDGALWLALREARLLRRAGEPGARVVRR